MTEHQPLALGVKVGFVLLAAGLLAWLWLGEWRWAASGFVALLIGAVVSSTRGGST